MTIFKCSILQAWPIKSFYIIILTVGITAADETIWTNTLGDGDWNSIENWSNGLPGDAIFPSPIPGNPIIIFQNARDPDSIRFDDDYTIQGAISNSRVIVSSSSEVSLAAVNGVFFSKEGPGPINLNELNATNVDVLEGHLQIQGGITSRSINVEDLGKITISSDQSSSFRLSSSGQIQANGNVSTSSLILASGSSLTINEGFQFGFNRNNETWSSRLEQLPITINGNGSFVFGDRVQRLEIYDSAAPIDLIIDSRIISTHERPVRITGGGTIQLNNPNNDFALQIGTVDVIPGTNSALGSKPIEFRGGGSILAPEGRVIELKNDLVSPRFRGSGQLVALGVVDGQVYLENMAPVVMRSNGGSPIIRGTGDLIYEGGLLAPTSFNWQSSGVLRIATEGTVGNLDIFAGDVVIDGNQEFSGRISLFEPGNLFVENSEVISVNSLRLMKDYEFTTNFEVVDDLRFFGSRLAIGPNAIVRAGRLLLSGEAVNLKGQLNVGQSTIHGLKMEEGSLLASNGSVSFTGDNELRIVKAHNATFLSQNVLPISRIEAINVSFQGQTNLAGTVVAETVKFDGESNITGGIESATMSLSGRTTISRESEIKVDDRLFFEVGSETLINGATVRAGSITAHDEARIQGHGKILAEFSASPGAKIIVGDGGLTIGNQDSFAGFNYGGNLEVGSNSLTILSKGFTRLGNLTTVTDGSLTVPNGLVIDSGNNLVGSGSVTGPLVLNGGATIQATGELRIGDSNVTNGFFGDGSLKVGSNTVQVDDANVAVLGSLTTLGDEKQGRLIANNSFLLEAGKDIVGYGVVESPNDQSIATVIQGNVVGNSLENPIEFTGYVEGIGSFSNVRFTGTFSPGNSIGDVDLGPTQLGDSNELRIEITGAAAGLQSDLLDNVGGIELGGTLRIVPIAGYQDPIAQGERHGFEFIRSDKITGKFHSILYNNNLLLKDGGETHIDGGLFRTLKLSADHVEFSNYLAYPGDSNGDGEFSTQDLVSVFVKGQYEDGVLRNSDWTAGDWNGDAEFDTSDLVFAFQFGRYEQNDIHPVPEPLTHRLLIMVIWFVSSFWLHRVRLKHDSAPQN